MVFLPGNLFLLSKPFLCFTSFYAYRLYRIWPRCQCHISSHRKAISNNSDIYMYAFCSCTCFFREHIQNTEQFEHVFLFATLLWVVGFVLIGDVRIDNVVTNIAARTYWRSFDTDLKTCPAPPRFLIGLFINE